MATFFVCEAVNLFVGDNGPNNSKHLNIMNVKHPDFDEKTAEHHPGGAIGALEVGGMGFAALTLTFKIAGADPQAMIQFGLGSKATQPYTIYGLTRDKNGNKPIEEKSIIMGRMSKVTRSEFKRGDMTDQDHEIKEITHYEYYFNKAEIYYYDFLSSQWRVNGVDQKADENTILRIA
jgi:P2 family phage contractile tail tube protein